MGTNRLKTFGAVLDETRGIGRGFDFLRIALSLSILFTHSFLIAEGERHQFSGPLLGMFHDILVPMFFALSGFLITGSALRLKLSDFLLNRGLRIGPALAVDICLSALIIGPLFTVFPLKQYIGDYEFRAYFSNIFGVIHYFLPGVFVHNPFPLYVNGSLWTVPYEIVCYVIMVGLIVFGFLKRPILAVAATAALSALIIFTLATTFNPLGTSHKTASNLLDHFFGHGLSLYISFMLGSLSFLFRRRIPYSPALALVCAAGLVAAAAAFPRTYPGLICAYGAPAVAYITTVLGLTPLPRVPLYSRGDYSYGIYLYGYPIQQALVATFPWLTSPWFHFAASVCVVTLVAIFSWHCIEKPILGLRKKLSFTAQKGDAVVSLPDAEAVTVEDTTSAQTTAIVNISG